MRKGTRLALMGWLAALCAVVAFTVEASAQTVRLHGATSLEKMLGAKRQAVEGETGLKLEIVGNGTGRGLADLLGGRADIAMIGGPLKGVARVMNEEKPGSVDTTGLVEVPLANVKLVFITHPVVGIKALTAAQARDVLTGKAANWKDVGGPDLPIKVVLSFTGDGARISVQEDLLQGADYAKNGIVRNSAKDMALVVSQLPGACALLSNQNAVGKVTTVPLDKEILMPMQLVVKGEPTGDVKKVVDAAKKQIK